MPDLLAHALAAYGVARLASLRYDWLTRPYVTAAMAGAFVPDVMKLQMVFGNREVAALLGVPFHWGGLRTGGAAVLFVLVGTMLVVPKPAVRRRATAALAAGAATHLLADTLLRFPTGRAHPLLWPLTRWHPPHGGLALSVEPGPTVAAGLFALAAWATWRRRGPPTADARRSPGGGR
jgi:hypothetical protein